MPGYYCTKNIFCMARRLFFVIMHVVSSFMPFYSSPSFKEPWMAKKSRNHFEGERWVRTKENFCLSWFIFICKGSITPLVLNTHHISFLMFLKNWYKTFALPEPSKDKEVDKNSVVFHHLVLVYMTSKILRTLYYKCFDMNIL